MMRFYDIMSSKSSEFFNDWIIANLHFTECEWNNKAFKNVQKWNFQWEKLFLLEKNEIFKKWEKAAILIKNAD